MDKRKRTFIGLTLIFLFGGVTVLVIALSSDHWVKVVPRFDLGNNTSDKRNRSGLITYGLFRGKKILNFGTGDRPDEIFDLGVSKLFFPMTPECRINEFQEPFDHTPGLGRSGYKQMTLVNS